MDMFSCELYVAPAAGTSKLALGNWPNGRSAEVWIQGNPSGLKFRPPLGQVPL
jgi:hypothetical protein